MFQQGNPEHPETKTTLIFIPFDEKSFEDTEEKLGNK